MHDVCTTYAPRTPLVASLVRKGGLEPPHLSAPEPKSGASTNSATFALLFSLVQCSPRVSNQLYLFLPQDGSLSGGAGRARRKRMIRMGALDGIASTSGMRLSLTPGRTSCPDSHPQRPLAHMIACMTSLQPNQNPIRERGKGSELE